ncbi:MAG TPA: transporter [Phycisphaerales bacterium]|nr:transporter [Phycisphaerales bacterium]
MPYCTAETFISFTAVLSCTMLVSTGTAFADTPTGAADALSSPDYGFTSATLLNDTPFSEDSSNAGSLYAAADPAALLERAYFAENSASQPDHRLRSWELPPVNVVGSPSALREEELVGSYGQPRWTATRRFPTTRVYVIPEGKVEIEAWARGTFDGDESEWRFLQEVEIGLPHRFQLDLYLRQDYDSESNETLWGGQFEFRYAFADWGEIWGNPTFYFEYLYLDSRPDKIEPKLLLGGEIAEGWHWAVNFVMEWEISGEEEEHEYNITSAISYTLVDSKLSVGVESIYLFADVKGDRGHYTPEFVIGPDVQWHPTEAFYITVAPLFGVNENSPDVQLWLNMGWEF